MKQSEIAKDLNIPVKIFIEMESCMLTACGMSHILGKLTLIQCMIDSGIDRDIIYERCGNDEFEFKAMFQECMFLNEMINRGYTDTKKDDNMVWRYIYYWREL